MDEIYAPVNWCLFFCAVRVMLQPPESGSSRGVSRMLAEWPDRCSKKRK